MDETKVHGLKRLGSLNRGSATRLPAEWPVLAASDIYLGPGMWMLPDAEVNYFRGNRDRATLAGWIANVVNPYAPRTARRPSPAKLRIQRALIAAANERFRSRALGTLKNSEPEWSNHSVCMLELKLSRRELAEVWNRAGELLGYTELLSEMGV